MLTTVTATDADAGVNKALHYTIVSGGRGRFEIGRTSGKITLASSLDRETEQGYTLNVSATDGGAVPLHGYMTIYVVVEDANDNPPIFQPTNTYSAVLAENVTVGTFVQQVCAYEQVERRFSVKFACILCDLSISFVDVYFTFFHICAPRTPHTLSSLSFFFRFMPLTETLAPTARFSISQLIRLQHSASTPPAVNSSRRPRWTMRQPRRTQLTCRPSTTGRTLTLSRRRSTFSSPT